MQQTKYNFKTLYSANSIKKWICNKLSKHAWHIIFHKSLDDLQLAKSSLCYKKIDKNAFIDEEELNIIKKQLMKNYGIEIPLYIVCKGAKVCEISQSNKQTKLDSLLNYFNLN